MLSIRVLVASDIRLYREELGRVLGESPEFTVVGRAGSAAEAVEQTLKFGADVALLDMAMSDALSVAKNVARAGGFVKIVALGMSEDEARVLSCVQVGVAGYVTHDGSVEDVVAAIEAAARVDVRCSPKLAGSLSRRVASMSTGRSRRMGNGALTAREAQILKLVQERMSNKMISRVLGIVLSNVKNHVHSILVKLGISRRAEVHQPANTSYHSLRR
jgi:two-component system nitrate/nitrite response regulator NarL